MVTCGWIVVDYCPQKANLNRSCLIVKGNQIHYPWGVITPTVDLTTVTLLFNSTISILNAKFFTVDVNNYYLNTLLDCLEYIQLHIDLNPNENIQLFNLSDFVDNKGWVYV